MNNEELLKVIKEVESYLQDHREDTSLSGHFDTVPGNLADKFSKAAEVLSLLVLEGKNNED
jgi:hypothetical protein